MRKWSSYKAIKPDSMQHADSRIWNAEPFLPLCTSQEKNLVVLHLLFIWNQFLPTLHSYSNMAFRHCFYYKSRFFGIQEVLFLKWLMVVVCCICFEVRMPKMKVTADCMDKNLCSYILYLRKGNLSAKLLEAWNVYKLDYDIMNNFGLEWNLHYYSNTTSSSHTNTPTSTTKKQPFSQVLSHFRNMAVVNYYYSYHGYCKIDAPQATATYDYAVF